MKGLIYLLLLASAVVAASAQQYPWWHRCNWCTKNAECINDTFCRCKAGFVGNPYFLCWKPSDFYLCEHCDDPTIVTEPGNAVSVSYAGGALLADNTVTRPGGGWCRFQVTTVASRALGHVRPRYIIIKLIYKKPNGQICIRYLRICAKFIKGQTAADNNVEYEIATGTESNNVLSWNVRETLSLSGRKAYPNNECSCNALHKISDGGQLRITFSCCQDVEIGFRPYVPITQWFLKSGIYILFPKPNLHILPSIPSNWNKFPVCLNPAVTPNDVVSSLGLESVRQALVYLALTGNCAGIPEIPGVQYQLANVLLSCSRWNRLRFFQKVFFMLHKHEFIAAISDGAEGNFIRLLELLLQAAKWICNNNHGQCTQMMSTINARCGALKNDPSRNAEMMALLNGGC